MEGRRDGSLNVEAVVRRSGRNRKPSAKTTPEYIAQVDELTGKPTMSEKVVAQLQPVRHNSKRKAQPGCAPTASGAPDKLLDLSLEPWKDEERDEWASWIEVESEPTILDLLGVRDLTVEEVYSLDALPVHLPQPLYGLIFLYQYAGEEDVEASVQGGDVWFANQTTENACATVAMLNILMNTDGLKLGPSLESFKQQSASLSPQLRGNLITNTSWIRKAHNAFARRMDLLDAALALQNEVDGAKKKRRRISKAHPKKTKPSSEAAFHFIAYVPVRNKVWLLDGLKEKPCCIGECSQDQQWTSIAQPDLEARMLQYETDQLSFSLIGLCAKAQEGTVERASYGTSHDAVRLNHRTKDYMPAIHAWVKRLSERGTLRQLNDEVVWNSR